MITRVDYWPDPETPDNTGWYICHYDDIDAMLSKSPYDTIGPYDTEAEAKRVLIETTDNAENTSARKKAYDPSHDPAHATLDAGIPTDNDDLDDELNDDEADPDKGVQLELQQTQELRDVPKEVQGD
jgi:hypothetical protein